MVLDNYGSIYSLMVLGRMYKQVLDEGYKIRVLDVSHDGCALMTYKERNWLFGIIKDVYDEHLYEMRCNMIVDLRMMMRR